MQYIRRDLIYIFFATFVSSICCVLVFWYLMRNNAHCENDLKICNSELETCNFEISKATEIYVQTLETYYRTLEALHITESKFINSQIQLENLKKKYPNETIYIY